MLNNFHIPAPARAALGVTAPRPAVSGVAFSYSCRFFRRAQYHIFTLAPESFSVGYGFVTWPRLTALFPSPLSPAKTTTT